MAGEKLQSWDGHNSEDWHSRARTAFHYAQEIPGGLNILEKFADQHERFSDERLQIKIGGIEFENPIMVGAGWDKTGEAISALNRLGFSGVEVGSVLAFPQPGNDKPRQWMIAPGVSFNRLGFNSPGMNTVAEKLEKYQRTGQETGVIGISIGKNKTVPDNLAPDAHFNVAEKLYDYAGYFAINVSSPNTPGLRNLQGKEPLTDIVHAVNDAMDQKGERKPLFIKIAPDNLTPDAINDIIRVVIDNGLTGIIATNTTINSEIKGKYGAVWANEAGGLAGNDPDYRKMSTDMVRHIFKETNGDIELIGVGGVNSAETALEKIQAGAKIVQVVSAIRGNLPLRRAIFEQGKLPGKINRELVNWMDREGVANISEIVGSNVR